MITPEEIYLIPDSEHDLVWCDTAAPGEGMQESDAVKYVRYDAYLKQADKADNLEIWISGLSDAHNAVPEWIRNKAKAILAELAE